MDHVLILGASSDLAKPLALHYAKAGYGLYLITKTLEKSERLKKDLAIRTNTSVKTGVYDAEAPETAAECWAALDPKPVGVICLIGYLGDEKKAQHEFKEAKRIIDSNYTGCVALLQQAANCFAGLGQGFIDPHAR